MVKDTSWEADAKHYHKQVGRDGHYYHQQVVIPQVIEMLELENGDSVLDVGCGQGVLARGLNIEVAYCGIDASKSLIEIARRQDNQQNHKYEVMRAEEMKFDDNFKKVVVVLSLQNMEKQDLVIRKIAENLSENGILVIVLNHPCFRIPRQSGWGEHENKIQYRYVNRYLTSLEIPILMHPGQRDSAKTWSYHQPLSFYINELGRSGLLVDKLEEWTSDKQSFGKAAKMENRSRSEIPLFMAIRARKKN